MCAKRSGQHVQATLHLAAVSLPHGVPRPPPALRYPLSTVSHLHRAPSSLLLSC